MHSQSTLCLHFPVTVNAAGKSLSGELYLPRDAGMLRVCIVRDENAVFCRRLGSLLSDGSTATLTLRSNGTVTAGEMVGIVDWIRSRRLLQGLRIKLIAGRRNAPAVTKAAYLRPVAVSA